MLQMFIFGFLIYFVAFFPFLALLEYSLLECYAIKKSLSPQQRLEIIYHLEEQLQKLILYSFLRLSKNANIDEKLNKLEEFSYLKAAGRILLSTIFFSIGLVIFLRQALFLFNEGSFIRLLIWIFWLLVAVLSIINSLYFWWRLTKIHESIIIKES